MSAYFAPRRYPVGALVSCWRYYAQHQGITHPDTQIDAVPAETQPGWWPAFVTAEGVQVVITMSSPAPSAQGARNRLRDLLWQAHLSGAICLSTTTTTIGLEVA